MKVFGIIALMAGALMGGAAHAQDITDEELEALGRQFGEEFVPDTRPEVSSVVSDAVLLRGLDKLTGKTTDFVVPSGETARYERLFVRSEVCRHPPEGDKPDAFAFLQIQDMRQDEPSFKGWMIASSPALSALDHVRYDVWVLKCMTTSEAAAFESASQSD